MTQATPAGQGTKGSASSASYLASLVAEREPSIESLVLERDRILDTEFYTGLGAKLAASIQYAIDMDYLRRDLHRYERKHRHESR